MTPIGVLCVTETPFYSLPHLLPFNAVQFNKAHGLVAIVQAADNSDPKAQLLTLLRLDDSSRMVATALCKVPSLDCARLSCPELPRSEPRTDSASNEKSAQ